MTTQISNKFQYWPYTNDNGPMCNCGHPWAGHVNTGKRVTGRCGWDSVDEVDALFMDNPPKGCPCTGYVEHTVTEEAQGGTPFQ